MLVLTRKVGETIRIGDDIELTVLAVERGGNVRLGIAAPRSTRILRGELLEEVAGENRAAAVNPEHLPDLSWVKALKPKADGQ